MMIIWDAFGKRSTKICWLGCRSTERMDCMMLGKFWQRRPSFLGSSGNQVMPKWVTISFLLFLPPFLPFSPSFFFLSFHSFFLSLSFLPQPQHAEFPRSGNEHVLWQQLQHQILNPLGHHFLWWEKAMWQKECLLEQRVWEPHPYPWVHLRAGRSFPSSLAYWSNERRKWKKFQKFSKPGPLTYHLSWNLHFGASVW